MYFTAFKKFVSTPFTLLLFGLVICLLAFSTQTLDATLAPRFTLFGALLFLLALVSLFLNSSLKKTRGAIVPFLLFLVVEAFSLLYATNYSEGIFIWLRDAGLFLFLLYFIAWFKSDFSVLNLAKVLLLVNTVITFLGLFQYVQADVFYNQTKSYEVVSLLGHRNLFASALVLCLPFALYTLLYSGKFWRFFAVVIVALNLFLIFALQSRTAWLALLVFLMSLLLWKLIAVRIKNVRIAVLRNVLLTLGALALLTFSIAYSVHKSEDQKGKKLTSQLGFNGSDQQDFTVKERLQLWQGTFRMIWEEGYGGVGAGNWKILFPAYGSDMWRARQGLVQFQRPHNDYLWVLAETGIIGLLTYLGGFIWVLVLSIQVITKLQKQEKILVGLLLSGLVSYFVIAFFSFPRERMFHQLMLYTYLGILLSLQPNSKTGVSNLTSRIVHFFGLLISLAIFCLGLAWYKGERAVRKINDARVKGNWQQLQNEYKTVAQNKWYKMDATATPLSFYSGLAYLNLGEYQKAQNAFVAASLLHPNNINVLNNCANVYFLQGKQDTALIFYKRALEVSPKYLDGALNLMAAYYNSGDINNAYAILRKYEAVFLEELPNFNSLQEYRLAILKTKFSLLLANQKQDSIDFTFQNINAEQMEKAHFQSIEKEVSLEAYLKKKGR